MESCLDAAIPHEVLIMQDGSLAIKRIDENHVSAAVELLDLGHLGR